MIIGVDATQDRVQYGVCSDAFAEFHRWDGAGEIETLPIRIQSLIKDQPEITKALVITGPGSYTGIRLSLTTLKMLSLVKKIPLNGVSLFDAYMVRHCFIFSGLILLTSLSRKGVVNAQLFQVSNQDYRPISSLLQLDYLKLNHFLAQFKVPISWHHFGDQLPISSPHGISVQLDLLQLLQFYYAKPFENDGDVDPIYAYPAVIKAPKK